MSFSSEGVVSSPSPSRRLIRLPGLGPALMVLYRLGIALRHLGRETIRAVHWWGASREFTNFTYELTETNRRQLAAYVAAVAGCEIATASALMDELEADDGLRDHLRRSALEGPDAALCDPEPHYGRRLGWYALARLRKPRLIVESGVDKGLGACVLSAALARNTEEGHPGSYLGLDVNPVAGGLFRGAVAELGEIRTGDSLDSLRSIQAIDLFIHDSDHSEAHEAREYACLEERLAPGALVLSDNAHGSDALFEFARLSGRRFLFFREEPRDHWYPGAGIGAAFG